MGKRRLVYDLANGSLPALGDSHVIVAATCLPDHLNAASMRLGMM